MNNDIAFSKEQNHFTLRAGAIIIKNNSVLMAKHKDIAGYYSIGGKVKFNESTQQAVTREVFEETGLKLQVHKLAFVHEYFHYHPITKEPEHQIVFYYVMKPLTNQKLISNSQVESLHWIPLTELPKHIIYPSFFKDKLLNNMKEIQHVIDRV